MSFVCGMSLIPVIVDFCKRRRLFDLPDARKRHKTPVPRLGGICFLPCMVFSFFLATFALRFFDAGKQAVISVGSVDVLIGALMLYVVGVIDDIVGVRARRKLIAQIAAACMLPVALLYINNFYGLLGIGEIPFFVGVPLTVFVVVGVVNAMNLIDGIDGLCSGLSIIALLGYGVLFAMAGMWAYVVMVAGLVGVLTAYTYFNMFSTGHKIFMGDSGSLTLGFALSFFFVKLSMVNRMALPMDDHRMIMAASFLIVPCFDVLRVMGARKRMGRGIFTPDRNHIHHRLIDGGCSMHQALAVILLLDLALVGLNALLLWAGVQVTLIAVIDVVAFMGFFKVLRGRQRKG